MHSEFAMNEPSLSEAPPCKLYPVRGAVWAAFWGSPVAAGIVMAINYARLGKKGAAFAAAAIGLLTTLALFAVIFALPDDLEIPNSVFYVPQLVIVYFIANALQGESIQNHLSRGGVVTSAWPAVGIGALCLPFVLFLIIGIVIVMEPSYGTLVEFGDDEIYYSGTATEDDARRLAGVLQEIQFFGSGGSSVRLETSAGKSNVSFILMEGAWKEAETVTAFKFIGHAITAAGFAKPLTIQLCDDNFTPHETLVIP